MKRMPRKKHVAVPGEVSFTQWERYVGKKKNVRPMIRKVAKEPAWEGIVLVGREWRKSEI